jgi:hypothetical protein
MQQERIFGIGLSKTGTTSLTRALQILGYQTKHFPFGALRHQSGELDMDVERLRRWDAATDSPIALFYQRIEQNFPNAKFVLTVRDVESWLNSCEYNHVWPGDYVRNKGIRLWPHISKILSLHRNVYGSEKFQRDIFRRAYKKHNESVVKYFRKRNRDVLIMDICAGDGWQKLCDFLGVPVPDLAFPVENVGKLKRLKKVSRIASWRLLSWLPTPTLNEQRVQRIIASRAYSD